MSISVRQIDDADRASWDAYIAVHPSATIYHQYRWRDFYRSYFGKETHYFVAASGDDIVGVVPVVRQDSRLFGNYCVSLPFFNYGGLLSSSRDAEDALVEALQRHVDESGADYVELRGCSPVTALLSKTHKVSMRLALPDSYDQLSAALGAKLRSQIKRPLRENPHVDIGQIELLDAFYSVFSRNMRDLGTPVYAKSMFAEILQRFPDSAEIVAVSIGEQTVAAGFLLHGQAMTEVPWASSDRRFNRVGVNMLLYSEMLKRSIERGASVFDFGRSSKDSGTYRFKKQWGAEPVQLYWSYSLEGGKDLPELSPENARYSAAISLWQRLPLPIANFVGPFLSRNLP
ncbi:MAG: FemAB family XrtA/PEP-CTERM system-associated protein [Pseudomonadota bacterium]